MWRIRLIAVYFLLEKHVERVTPKPYHGDLAVLLPIDGNTFTLELLQDFL